MPEPPDSKTTLKGRGLSKWIGLAFVLSRDALARRLLAVGIAPTALTILGLIFTAAAALFLALGAGAQPRILSWHGPSAWRLWAALAIVFCGASDMLDGAMAHLGAKTTRFGAFLDSIVDRYCDILLFLGIGIYYARHGNLTYQLLATVAMANALLISYTKARAEDFIPSCRVGFWERGERVAALLIATCFGGVPAVLWQLAVFPFFTALRRIQFTRRAIPTISQGAELTRDPAGKVTDGSLFDRCRRGSLIYDLVTGAYIAFIIFAPIDNTDLFRQWLS
ncbi:MAG: CDP-alcohol phosphatidyltransferase family protein [Phycisphaerae bacterium]|nr:CDP-alcohol phosphatidyltransferase family protein [Phycisphaerae bacterium]